MESEQMNNSNCHLKQFLSKKSIILKVEKGQNQTAFRAFFVVYYFPFTANILFKLQSGFRYQTFVVFMLLQCSFQNQQLGFYLEILRNSCTSPLTYRMFFLNIRIELNNIKTQFNKVESQYKLLILSSDSKLINMSIQIYFKVRCQTQFKQQVYIVGDQQSMGKWNPQEGIKLDTNGDIYPLWIGTLIADFEPNQLIKFKAAILESENIIWESTENRVVQVWYQSQTVLFTFDSSPLKMIKIKSFFDYDQDSEVETAYFIGARRRQLKTVVSPLECDYMSSDSESDNSNISSIFIDNIEAQNNLNNFECLTSSNFESLLSNLKE
ncbi:unnamed protein product [Paramecium octaurelia]|uniref:CBM20 domain-containing protein n=1 Tax=Paramecium octaurelia TaxID=43137 RepID=A0A8S1VW94_PAROT|nr:unnamed protein product [Paramecium octaurelia]